MVITWRTYKDALGNKSCCRFIEPESVSDYGHFSGLETVLNSGIGSESEPASTQFIIRKPAPAHNYKTSQKIILKETFVVFPATANLGKLSGSLAPLEFLVLGNNLD